MRVFPGCKFTSILYRKSILNNQRDQWLKARGLSIFNNMGCHTFLSKATNSSMSHDVSVAVIRHSVNSLVLCGTASSRSNAQSLDYVGSFPVDCLLMKTAADEEIVCCGCIPWLHRCHLFSHFVGSVNAQRGQTGVFCVGRIIHHLYGSKSGDESIAENGFSATSANRCRLLLIEKVLNYKFPLLLYPILITTELGVDIKKWLHWHSVYVGGRVVKSLNKFLFEY